MENEEIKLRDTFCSKRSGRKWDVDWFSRDGTIGILAQDDRGWQKDHRWVKPETLKRFYRKLS